MGPHKGGLAGKMLLMVEAFRFARMAVTSNSQVIKFGSDKECDQSQWLGLSERLTWRRPLIKTAFLCNEDIQRGHAVRDTHFQILPSSTNAFPYRRVPGGGVRQAGNARFSCGEAIRPVAEGAAAASAKVLLIGTTGDGLLSRAPRQARVP